MWNPIDNRVHIILVSICIYLNVGDVAPMLLHAVQEINPDAETDNSPLSYCFVNGIYVF